MASAQTKISTTCLTYLTFEDFSCGRATCDQSFEERIDRHKLLRYASRHWGHHARKCEQELLQNENFVNILRKFLGNRSLTYAAGQASNAEGYWNGYSQEPAYWLWSHTLASFGLVEIFTRILSLHNGSHFEITDIDFEDEHCIMTPLALACSRGHEETVKVLLDSDVRLDSGVAFGYPTPLGHAINNGHHAVVQLFIDLRPDAVDLNSITHCRRRPPLTAAARNGFYDTVDVLIHHGQGRVAVDTIKDINRRTPLSYAAQFGHYKIVQLLTSLPAVNPNRKDKFGNTPLMLAAQNGHAEIVNLLMDLGPEKVNANHTNVSGRTALQEATVHNHLEAVEALVAYPPDRVDVNVCTEAFMQTALAYAAEKGLETIARALVSLGPGRVHLDAMGWRGATPLLCAAREGHVGIVELLTDYAQEVVDVNAVDVDGCTPLICAVQNEHYETAEFLVELGERVDAGIADVRGFTAWDYAFRREEKFEKLLPEP
ncbi:Ankyrin repeat domain-containing protein 50 [Lasiodiplodia theobromae]|uniref:Ankyrin repeat domain-containing protein 50 n=1 Tax=Lasiodiplodia theobromae TaxID=45133 RepID=UPI0015C3A19D|nr:Ankyrin repeat domain-containing protein 50 [Lasiodiplodia theobromae]KAF4534371.1 Ankyrin repeat domain-containing protein 50 [Lasiodiplodia theobromae]